MASKQPDKDLATALAAALGLAFGTDVKWGEPLSPAEPGAASVQLWVYTTGGPPPGWYMSRDAVDGHITHQRQVDVAVRVRALTADAYDVPQALARSVIDKAASLPLTMVGYDDVNVNVSEPLYLGPLDPTGQLEWNVPFTLKWTA